MTSPLRRKRSVSSQSSELQSTEGPAENLPRVDKSVPYEDPRYEVVLATAGVYMKLNLVQVSDTCKEFCQRLLHQEQAVPADSLFRDDLFMTTCEKIQNENKARIVKDITWLIVASAETLATYGATELDILIEKVNSVWLKSIPITDKRPQPDYSVGFRESAFTQHQLHKLSPFVGAYKDQCSVMATYDMYFPFLTYEVKCGDTDPTITNRQNMHSASVSVKGLVELFKRVGWEGKLDREVLAFSISHNQDAVQIYGHYASIDGIEARFYRHEIAKFYFDAADGENKWTAYKFTKSVYDIFVRSISRESVPLLTSSPIQKSFLWSLSSTRAASIFSDRTATSQLSCARRVGLQSFHPLRHLIRCLRSQR